MPKRVRHSSEPNSGSVKRLVKFNPSWVQDYPWVKGSGISVNHAFCKLCSVNFTVGHGGKYDLSQHAKSVVHLGHENTTKVNYSISSMLKSTESVKNATNAEVLFTNFIAEHNLPFFIAKKACNL